LAGLVENFRPIKTRPRLLIIGHNYGTFVSMLNVLYVTRNEGADFDRKVSAALRSVHFRKVPAAQALASGKVRHSPDFIVAGLEPGGRAVEIAGLHRAYPKSPIVVASRKLSSEISEKVYRAGAAAVVPLNALDAAIANLTQVFGPESPKEASALDEAIVEEFHDPASGRLNANGVARGLSISVAGLAKSIGLTASALSKRPHAKAAQEGLRQLEFVVSSLRRILGSDSRVRAWLNAPHPDLDGEAPLALLTQGSAKDLAAYVRAALAGQPT
jgi:hypothetical protein